MMKTIGVVTTGRQDFGIYLPVLRKIKADSYLNLHLIVAGMHWLPEFGNSFEEILREGFKIGAKVELPLKDDSPEGIAKAMGIALQAFAQSYVQKKPDILVVLGDRYEMHAACLAALPFAIPVAHIHGGELTEGAFDDALRHSITKMSHLHFVATNEYARRVRQLGEEEWRVVVSGAPALDHLKTMEFVGRKTLEEKFYLRLEKDPLLVTFHPVTLEHGQTLFQIQKLLKALQILEGPIIFTSPNADTKNQTIRKTIESFVKEHPCAFFVKNFGHPYYFSLLKVCRAMVGNSSSGLVEAASFELPVVNIGLRERGRIRAKNVIDVGYETQEIQTGLEKALSKEFRESLKGLKNLYGDGKAAGRIVKKLEEVSLNDSIVLKKFVDHENSAK